MEKLDKRAQERISKFINHPLWKDKPFWLLNLFQFRRDEDGDTKHARQSFIQYLKSAQRYAATALPESATQQEKDMQWYKGARLVSLTCNSAFSATQGEWDALVLYEYQSPQDFMQYVIASKDYDAASKDRVKAVAKSSQIAVKPTILVDDVDMPHEALYEAEKFSNEYWKKFTEGEIINQNGKEKPDIWPQPETMMKIFQSGRFKNRTFAVNLLRYKRSEMEPLGRTKYRTYANMVNEVIEKNMPRPRGVRCPPTPCFTLIGDSEWDEFAIMMYPNLKGFAFLPTLDGYDETKAFRENGLLTQGLILAEPDIINGVVLSGELGFEGLKMPQYCFQSKL